ncbi:alpha/beta hydrolase [Halobacillus karajensis]|uniref:alpha/beta hydrolase n=1 Tax=Halobacillus karajensis TaxID=195088 RepID=UPI001FD057C9|nr:alpha/beta hydrolase [Halobacillus karajensis]
MALLKNIEEKMIELEHPPLDHLTPEQSRNFYQEARTHFKELPVEGVSVTDTYFRGRSGNEVPVRLYTPEGEGTHPAVVYFHGGGWVFGDIESSDNVCRYLSRYAHTVVVSVGYRLAPEYKYPAAFYDAIDSIAWISSQFAKWNIDPERLAVAGESSGGNLAAASAIYFLDKEDVEISHQFLITPVLDYNLNTLSYKADYRYNLTKEKMEWFFGHYLNDYGEGDEVFVSPLRLRKVDRLPRTLLVTAEYDPLREEAFSFAERLKGAGVVVDHLHYEDLVHSFISMLGVVSRSKEAMQEMALALKEALHADMVHL